jgi:predicted NUDIX family NTP pyrophosphohydrolase
MPLVSAGLLMYRLREGRSLEVFLAHPGGPLFARKDEGAWTIPKGAADSGEDLRVAAVREFEEEIGLPVIGPMLELGTIRQKSGKVVHAWAFEGDAPDDFVPRSNEFEMVWPPRSGRLQRFPEVDRARFFELPAAAGKIIPAQAAFLSRLGERLLKLREGAG